MWLAIIAAADFFGFPKLPSPGMGFGFPSPDKPGRPFGGRGFGWPIAAVTISRNGVGVTTKYVLLLGVMVLRPRPPTGHPGPYRASVQGRQGHGLRPTI